MRGAASPRRLRGGPVAKLENAIGLSRGAIFNYFPSKEDLFIELAVRDSARMSEIWINEGLEAVVREVVELDPAWLSVYLELFRRVRNEPELPRADRVAAGAGRSANRERIEQAQADGDFRDDLAPKEIGIFVNLVLNGLALMRAGGEELPSTELVLQLLRDAIGPGSRPYACAYTCLTRATSSTYACVSGKTMPLPSASH